MIIQSKSALRGRQLKTGQTTSYHAADDGDYERGLSKVYTVYTTGQYSGTTSFNVAHYAANTISFTASTKTIADSANGLVTVLTGDTIVINGSASNDGTYTVAGGGVAGSFTTTEALADETAGAVVTIYKRAFISNNCVLDKNTGSMWLRNTTTGLKIGPVSTGMLYWYDATACFTLHPAAADLQMIAASNTLRVVGGAAEVTRYHVGDILDCTGFANAANNLPGYRVLSVTVNGANLDIVLDSGKNTLVSEAAAGARSILLVCRSIFTYCAAANAASVGGYTDWRIPECTALVSLMDIEAPSAAPDAVAFPGWPTNDYVHSSGSRPSATTLDIVVNFLTAMMSANSKNAQYYAALVRGGI